MDKIIAIQSCSRKNKLIQTALKNHFDLIWAQDEKQFFEILKNQTNTYAIITPDYIQSCLNLNPLTKLPGNETIKKVIKERLTTSVAVFYADIDNFKSYNDKYGFVLGDKIIKKTAQIISDSIKKFGNSTDFLGHLGGDDFIFISTPDKAEAIATSICQEFDLIIPKYYNKLDQSVKKIATKDRQGKTVEYPLMSISIAIITNEKKKLTSIAQISQIAAELKTYAKTKPDGKIGSNFVKERRK